MEQFAAPLHVIETVGADGGFGEGVGFAGGVGLGEGVGVGEGVGLGEGVGVGDCPGGGGVGTEGRSVPFAPGVGVTTLEVGFGVATTEFFFAAGVGQT